MIPEEFKVLIVVAGVPEDLSVAFSRRADRLCEGRRKVIFLPMARHRSYSDEYIADLYALFLSTVREFLPIDRITDNTPGWFEGAITIFVKHEDIKPNALIEAFGVETFMASVDTALVHGSSPNAIRSMCNSLLRDIRTAVRSSEKTLLAVSKQVASNANKTPLLLPFHNFDCKKMRLLRDHVMNSIGAQDPYVDIVSVVKKFESTVRRTKYGSDRYSSFVNSRDVVFRRPSAWHGENGILSADHDSSCYIRSRLRFGACINPRFHYDCVKNRGSLPAKWSSCHRQDYSLPQGRNHINIAPNDHTR